MGAGVADHRRPPGRSTDPSPLRSTYCWALTVWCCLLAATAPPAWSDELPAERRGEYVVVLHGLARSDRSMAPLAERIAAAGYPVFNVDYPSRHLGPAELVAVLDAALEQCCRDAQQIHFVTHSLGGILVRAYLAAREEPRAGRVVMLSPPNHGSELVDLLGDTWLFRAVMGPTAVQMGTGPGSLPNRLPPPDFDLGVIAATGTINPVGSAAIPGEDDGIVSLCSMWTDGARDLVTVSDSHAFVMRSPEVARQTLLFLDTGRFEHGPDDVRDLLGDCERGSTFTAGDGG